MTPELLHYFFKEKSNVFSLLTEKELKALNDIYKAEQYKDLLPNFNISIASNKRTVEFPVNCPGIIILDNTDNLKMHVVNVSKTRLAAFLSEKLFIADTIKAKIEIAQFELINLTLKLVFCDMNELYYNFEVIKHDESWIKFIEYSEKKLLLMKTAVFNVYKKRTQK